MFEVGQKVWDVLHGEGTVSRIGKNYAYPVLVKFTNDDECSLTPDGKRYADHEIPSLYPYPVEVVKKVTKPTINWEHVRGEYKFLAQDTDGSVWLYWEKPRLGGDHWVTTRGECAEAHSYASYIPGTCNWKDSLVTRPEGV